MGAMVSQITSLTIVYSTSYSGPDQRKHQSSASLAFVRGIHRSPVNSPHKGPVTWKRFPFDDVITPTSPCFENYLNKAFMGYAVCFHGSRKAEDFSIFSFAQVNEMIIFWEKRCVYSHRLWVISLRKLCKECNGRCVWDLINSIDLLPYFHNHLWHLLLSNTNVTCEDETRQHGGFHCNNTNNGSSPIWRHYLLMQTYQRLEW